MRTTLLIITTLFLFNTYSFAQGTIWNGPMTSFTKAGFAEFDQAANQDRITPNVWITRGDTEGIFNIKTESDYDKLGRTSPADTEWAMGTTSNLGSLVFDNWYNAVGGTPPSMLNQNMVVHLITDDIYIDIKFTSWTGAVGGGGFTYERSTEPVFGTNESSIKSFTISKNPCSSQIKLNLPKSITRASVQIFDVLGKEVYSVAAYQNPIDVSSLEKGVYLVKVSDLKSKQTKQFIKN